MFFGLQSENFSSRLQGSKVQDSDVLINRNRANLYLYGLKAAIENEADLTS